MLESDKRLEELEKKKESILNALLDELEQDRGAYAWRTEQRNDTIGALGELLEQINTMRCMQNFKEARSRCSC